MKSVLPSFLASNNIDFCIVNGENAAHGLGITSKIADEIFSLGADAITLGNHTFSSADFVGTIKNYRNIARPANVSASWNGNDIVVVSKPCGDLGVINLMGQVGMIPCDNPFTKADELIGKLNKDGIRDILVDFHAEATSEKNAMGHYLDGRASLVLGTHTHVATADERVLKGGTGFITDAGMTGVCDSVIGMDIDTSLRRLKDKLPAKYEPAEGEASVNGIIATVEDGKCLSIKRFSEYE